MSKVVIASDSYKGNMRSPVVCSIIEEGLKSIVPDVETIKIPMADGGEGTVDSVISATHGVLKNVSVTGPLGGKVVAEYGLIGTDVAVMEMASASGIELVEKEALNPLLATTYGTGEVIKHIVENENVKEIIIGIGGSATVDGGCGMAQALGYQLLDSNGKEIKVGGGNLVHLETISSDKVDPKIKSTKIRVASDVTNPLLGNNGAAKIFGPQKGATPAMVDRLESGLSNLQSVLKSNGFITEDVAGDGAAGGLGLGLRAFCDATIESGATLMIEATGLKEHLKNCDLMITGEGCTDGQTSNGKLCSIVAEAAKEANVPVVLLSGAIKGDIQELLNVFDVALSISSGHGSLEKAIAASQDDLLYTIKNIARLVLGNQNCGLPRFQRLDAVVRMKSNKLLPVLEGSSWMIGPNPDLLAMGAIGKNPQECVDHHVFQGLDGNWHLWGCIRNSPVGRVLYHWEADSLEQEDWKQTGEMIRADRSAGECLNGGNGEQLMSPFVVFDKGQFYMFYSGTDIGDTGPSDDLHLTGAKGLCQMCLQTSSDGRNWTRHKNEEGFSRVFLGPGNVRDPALIQIDGVWHMYYAGYHGDDRLNAGTYLRTSTNLVDWSDWQLVHYSEHFHHHPYMAESPAVVEKDGLYYLFLTENYQKGRSYIFCSDDPTDFGVEGRDDYDVNRYFVGMIPVAAPEIITDQETGEAYITTCTDLSGGVRMHRLKWVSRC